MIKEEYIYDDSEFGDLINIDDLVGYDSHGFLVKIKVTEIRKYDPKKDKTNGCTDYKKEINSTNFDVVIGVAESGGIHIMPRAKCFLI